ncbi:MAG: tRNA (N6-isopentenyl adenosine(37)-C2)-methylthiotransferase MiaB [Myxococcales bacterium]|nr:MAG: tRNA (N6-isopentenyl adenosine(37)-C2)-methylthiotransferase MiaB [Myxococcales bacterium]
MARFTVITFGCQMNSHDSERIGEVLRGAGHSEAEGLEDADLVLLNTCSIREKAEQKLRSEVGRIALLKQKRPELTIAVAGCVAQQEGENLLRRMPDVDLLLGPDNIPELPRLLLEAEGRAEPVVRTEFDLDAPHFLAAAAEPGRTPVSAFVTVMKGCNERCTYCIVPHTRGPERYRPAREIIDEVRRLVGAGAREVTLLGQTVNSYRDPLASLPPAPGAGEAPWQHTRGLRAREDESEFAALLRAIAAEVPELLRLRYTSPHPRHLTVSLIRAHQDLRVLARHVHLPVQAGSDRVLRRMLRRYSSAEYEERVAALRQAVPGVTVATDMIVGFPGETSEDFEQTLALVERVGFSIIYGFKYSERPYTAAVNLGDDVTEAEKAERLARLIAMGDRMRTDALREQVGTRQSVLFEGRGKTGALRGRTERSEIVHAAGPDSLIGQLREVEVTGSFKNSLLGEIPGVDAQGPQPRQPLPGKPSGPRALPVVP